MSKSMNNSEDNKVDMTENISNSETKKIDKSENTSNLEDNKANMSENVSNSESKKSNFTKIIVIFLVFFLVASVLVTAGLIYYKNKIEYEIPNTENEPAKVNENFGMKSLNEMYAVNDIKYSTCYEGFGEYVEEYGQSKIQINYIQISGLKNVTVQNKINKKIKSAAEEYYNFGVVNDPNIKSVSVNCYVTANFANVLSICLYGWTSYNTGAEDEQFTKGLNYNLATGEEITFEKMFNSDANIKSILSQSAYEHFSYNYANNEDLEADMDLLDYSEIERKVFNFINKYNNREFKEFHFDAKNIYLIFEKSGSLSIDMKDFYEQIAIYNRYKSYSDLYTGEYDKKLDNIPCFVDMSYKYYFEMNEIANNAISCICVTDNGEYSYIVDPYYEKYIEEIKLEHMKMAKNEKNILISTEINSGVYDGFVHISTNTIKYNLNENMYTEVRDFAIYEELRNMPFFEGPYILYDAENKYYNKYTYTYKDYEYDEFSGRLLGVNSSSHIYDALTGEYVEISTEADSEANENKENADLENVLEYDEMHEKEDFFENVVLQ